MQYIRVSDSLSVSRDEACTPAGAVKPGYSVRVGMLADGQRVGFMDSSASAAITDIAVTLTDAASLRAVAKARNNHDLRYAHLGDRAPAFTDAQAQAAATQATTMRDAAPAADIVDVQTACARHLRDAALAQLKIDLRNAWKTPR